MQNSHVVDNNLVEISFQTKGTCIVSIICNMEVLIIE